MLVLRVATYAVTLPFKELMDSSLPENPEEEKVFKEAQQYHLTTNGPYNPASRSGRIFIHPGSDYIGTTPIRTAEDEAEYYAEQMLTEHRRKRRKLELIEDLKKLNDD